MSGGRPPAATEPKSVWRRWAGARAPVPPDVAAAVTGHLVGALGRVRGAVLAYVALPDETDVGALLTPGTIPGNIVLPRMAADGTMTLRRDDGSREHHPDLALAQPSASAIPIAPEEIALVLVPGRVFDVDGYRLGRGGGHYDRLLPNLAPDVPVIGVSAAAGVVGRLPRDGHDKPMTHVATEAGIFRAGSDGLRVAAEANQ